MVNNKIKSSLIIASITVNVLFVMFFIGKRFYYSHWQYFHHSKTSEERWNEFFSSKPDINEVIFIGTSITEGFPVKDEFKKSSVKNMGFAGSISINGIQVLNRLIKRKPAKVFIEFGINDIKYSLPIDTIKAHLKTMIALVRSKSPDTKIYVQSVLPTNSDTLNVKIINYNKEAERLCVSEKVDFINLYPAFLRGNKIDQDLTYDGTHLTKTGYYQWRKSINGFIK